jgi:uncharacterized protein YtpQ (UPF0354 family)
MKTGLPLNPEAFATHVACALAQAPGIEILTQDKLSLQLRVQGLDSRVNLDNFYLQYRRAPEMLEQLTNRIVSQTLASVQAVRIPDLTTVAAQLHPQIKPQQFVDALRKQGAPALITRPFIADLVITFVIDAPDHMIPVNTRHTAAWQIDEPTLYQMAMANLEQRETQYAVYGEGPQRLHICQSLDGYDATRILLAAMLDEWAEDIRPHRLLLGVPNRDFLIGFPDGDCATVKAIATQIHRDAASREYSLTDRVLVWENGTLREYGR